VKRTRVIEFCDFNDISYQIPQSFSSTTPRPPAGESTTKVKSNSEEIQTTIATIKFIDQQRLEINRQLATFETFRFQLDTFGVYLNQQLFKLVEEGHRSEN
jgi:hypothetical protein